MAGMHVNVHVTESDAIEAAAAGEGEDATTWLRIGWGVSVWIDNDKIGELRLALDDLERLQSMGRQVAA